MLRFSISESGQPPLPPVDLEGSRVVIGSAADARIRIPSQVAIGQHIELTRDGWRALADVIVDGAARAAGDSGPIGAGVAFELGSYRVHVAPSPVGASESTPQRTESLARELVRSLLGTGAAPTLQIERGPSNGAIRSLPPPESVLIIGRGDDAGWPILDEDLSRLHAEIRRGWDGVTVRDLGSKNGTRVGGARVGDAGVELHDGDLIELGALLLRFRDPAERHLRGPSSPEGARRAPTQSLRIPAQPGASPARSIRWPLVIAVAIGALAIGALAWIVAGCGGGAVAEAQRARTPPVRAAVVDRACRVQIADAIAAARRRKPAAELTKAELRAPMHVLVPMLTECYRQAQARDPDVSGVANTRFVVESEPGHGTIFAARGFDPAGALGNSPEFRACIGERLDAIVLPPIGTGGRAEITYPITFAPSAPNNRGAEVVDEANRAAAAGAWTSALRAAERGLELTSLDGPRRRRLIEVAGLAACHLRNEAKARHYYALASPAAEATIREACARQARLKLAR